jgi:hypothetical protein
MSRTSKFHLILEASESSNLLRPSGEISAFNTQGSHSYAAIKANAVMFFELCSQHGFSVQPGSHLKGIFDQVVELSDSLLTNSNEGMNFKNLLGTLQMARISNAALSIRDSECVCVYLKNLLDGSLDLLARERSKAKDTLWEIELLNVFKENGVEARLDEPDLRIEFPEGSIGVACKKLYSEANVAKVLSGAVKQIEQHGSCGLVALNIDDLLPKNTVLREATMDRMVATLSTRVDEFIRRHERHLRRYLLPGRTIAALVSCATIADVATASPQFMNARQSIIWQVPGLPKDKEKQMSNLLTAFRQYR